MNQNHILIQTGDQNTLETVLFDLCNLYHDVPYSHGIQLYRRKGQLDLFLMLFTNNPDFDRFCYFVNYLKYPFDHTSFKPKVRGFFKSKETTTYPQLMEGDWLMIYVNDADTAGDNVYVTNETQLGYVYDFGGNLMTLENPVHSYKAQDVNLEDFNHILDFFPAPKPESSVESKPWWKFW